MKTTALIALALLAAACSNRNGDYDASGTFEATEVIVSAEGNGRIERFDVEEGQRLTAGEVVGSIDSIQLYLKKLQLEKSIGATQSRRQDIAKQIAATLEQIENVIQLIIANISGLFCDGAKASCSMKASVGIAAAYEAVYMAVEGEEKAQCEGILDPDVEHSIGNLSRIAISAMDSTDREIIDIMTCK